MKKANFGSSKLQHAKVCLRMWLCAFVTSLVDDETVGWIRIKYVEQINLKFK